MDNMVERLVALETRTRKIESQLRRWRVAALLLGLVAVSAGIVLPGQAQQPVPEGTVVNAPFTIKGKDGRVMLMVTDYTDDARAGAKDTLLTFYRNNTPTAVFRTTGDYYKDAADDKSTFLNVFETWLYRIDDKNPGPYLATSTALTRSGGSFVVFNEQKGKKADAHPPFAARITATEAGGRVILYSPDGKESKLIDSK
ncbi:MAG TPA: hypothetical protein VE988_10130 [Gemmataceae bacterium]|nr:hypothetical protein [Gemmataceae bacterium]